jgi:hypothetical protein
MGVGLWRRAAVSAAVALLVSVVLVASAYLLGHLMASLLEHVTVAGTRLAGGRGVDYTHGDAGAVVFATSLVAVIALAGVVAWGARTEPVGGRSK